MEFDEKMIVKRVPKAVVECTRENMDVYCMSLGDAFQEAVRECYHRSDTRLYRAWYASDLREYIPSAYYPEYLDFKKYPLAY